MKHPTEGKYTIEVGEENGDKNRYSNVLPWDHNRVVLKDGTYVNASPVALAGGKYIATQGPLRRTTGDFWQMCDEQCKDKVIVVMVTPLFEQTREQCYKYWNDTDFVVNGKKFELVSQKRLGSAEYVKTEWQMNGKPVVHYYYDQWQDFARPVSHQHIIELVADVAKEKGESKDPVVVHCSAGVGRTGTYIAVDALSKELGEVGESDPVEDTVREMRKQRMLMVQRPEQYQFIYDTLKLNDI